MFKKLRKAARNSGKFISGVREGLQLNGIYTVELTLDSCAHNGYYGQERVVALELLDINERLLSSYSISFDDIALGRERGLELGQNWRRDIDGPPIAYDDSDLDSLVIS